MRTARSLQYRGSLSKEGSLCPVGVSVQLGSLSGRPPGQRPPPWTETPSPREQNDRYEYERSQNTGPFQLSATLKQGAPLQVMDTRLLNLLTNDTYRRHIFKELHSTVQEFRISESQSLRVRARGRSHAS